MADVKQREAPASEQCTSPTRERGRMRLGVRRMAAQSRGHAAGSLVLQKKSPADLTKIKAE
jgi:hypothetical protein